MNATQTTTRRLIGFGAALAVTVPAALVMAAPASAVDSDTADMLQAMAVDEKLARDVYTALGDIYDVNQFDRIAKAEQQHLDAIRTLMESYGVDDATADDAFGEFDAKAVQDLYDKLVAQGEQSLAAAAQVGIDIEELDIDDLEDALATNPAADITRVFTALKNGSESHLAAFTRLASGDTMTAAQNGTGEQKGQGSGQGRGHGRGMQAAQNGTGTGVQNGTGTGARDGSCL